MIDRLEYALSLCRGRRVVDIGGSRMEPDGQSKFDRLYRRIQSEAASYRIIDRDKSADVVMDLNYPLNLYEYLKGADVILCMETLEHLRNPGLVCDAIRTAVRYGAAAFVTLPRSSLFCRYLERNGLGRWWGKCHHLYAFPDYHAKVFMDENFAGLSVKWMPCLGRYNWLWPLVWLATGGKGLSHGFLITKEDGR